MDFLNRQPCTLRVPLLLLLLLLVVVGMETTCPGCSSQGCKLFREPFEDSWQTRGSASGCF